jgi:hypothetical protein
MYRHKVRPGHFEQMNLQRERAGLALRRRMIEAAMAGRRSGFAVQMLDPTVLSGAAISLVSLRQTQPRAR